jgi:light-regulated signal transduction histidine kinase (bacteriophytochrome)
MVIREDQTFLDTQRAVLNILEDFSAEKLRLEDTQRAVLNVLEDFNAEKARLEQTQHAVLNILEDFNTEKFRLEGAQRAVLNILEDFNAEKLRLEDTQRAVLNVLEDFNAERLRLEDAQRATLNILEDLNEEKTMVEETGRELLSRTEELEAANKELESFSYSVSHDLRAPLRHIDGFADLLRKHIEGSLDDKAKRYLTMISGSAKQMGMLIDDLLAFSRVGRAEVRRVRVDLNRLVADVRRELEPDLKDRQVTWSVATLPLVHGDPALLRQVFVNLLGNAAKFTRTRETARIEIGCAAREGDDPVIFVRDNGVGFDMRYATKLFGVFQRLHRADEFEGTGIGLANVRRIVSKHSGRTWAEGVLNGGATFYFSLPQGGSHEGRTQTDSAG